MNDPVLTEIEIQLKLAQQALNNVVGFVARLNSASDVQQPADAEPPQWGTFEEVVHAPSTTTGERPNGRKPKAK